MSGPLRILILGAYGRFGGRLARLLADEPRLTLIVAGRDLAKAEAFRDVFQGQARCEATRLDRDGDLDAALRQLRPELVVDASGPFQAYGPQPYRVAEACLARGISYLDLADGADFVLGITALDEAAKARGCFVLSGVSTVPALSGAVVRDLAADLMLESVFVGIAPSPFAGVGLSVVRAVAGYAGKPVALWRDGTAAAAPGLIDSRRVTVAAPGHLPLRRRRFSLCEVPDLRLFPQLWPSLREVWVGAAPAPESLHRGLSLLAWLVRLRLVPTLAPFARLFHRATNRLRWGEDRGGMVVEVTGRNAGGRSVARAWHLVAEGDSGPHIPSMAAAAVVRRMLAGEAPPPGARAAGLDLTLGDFAPFFAAKRIVTGRRETKSDTPLFRQILGAAFDTLPAPVRRLHDAAGTKTFSGQAEVTQGRGLARLVARLFGLPRAGRDLPVSVTITAEPSRETWVRDFAGQRFRSHLSCGQGAREHLLLERFGPLVFAIALVREGERLSYVMRGWRLLGLPLPRCLAPVSQTFESAADGRFRFDVAIRLPLLGLLAHYRGWLAA